MSRTPDATGEHAPEESAHTGGLRNALRDGVISLLVLAVVSVAVWTLVDGAPGAWGALVGAGVGGVFVLLTVLVVVATARTSPQVTGAVLLGTWLLKLIVAIGVMAGIKGMDFYSRRALVVTLVVAMVVVLATETRAVLTNRAPYVEPLP